MSTSFIYPRVSVVLSSHQWINSRAYGFKLRLKVLQCIHRSLCIPLDCLGIEFFFFLFKSRKVRSISDILISRPTAPSKLGPFLRWPSDPCAPIALLLHFLSLYFSEPRTVGSRVARDGSCESRGPVCTGHQCRSSWIRLGGRVSVSV